MHGPLYNSRSFGSGLYHLVYIDVFFLYRATSYFHLNTSGDLLISKVQHGDGFFKRKPTKTRFHHGTLRSKHPGVRNGKQAFLGTPHVHPWKREYSYFHPNFLRLKLRSIASCVTVVCVDLGHLLIPCSLKHSSDCICSCLKQWNSKPLQHRNTFRAS